MEEKKLLNSINESRSESSLSLKNIPIEILDLVTEIINEINWNEKKINS